MIASTSYSHAYKGDVPDGGFEWLASSHTGYGHNAFDVEVRKILFDQYAGADWRTWYCPSADLHMDTFKFRTVWPDARWWSDPTWSPSGIGWQTGTEVPPNSQNHRGQVNYSYFVGPLRGFTGITGVNYQLSRVAKFETADAPALRIVWADNLKPPGTANAGATSTWTHPANTHDTNGNYTAQGTHNALIDGHVEWRKANWNVNTQNWVEQYYIYFP
jgi:hypothetical protein